MTFELPGSVWVLLVSWLLASVCVAAALDNCDDCQDYDLMVRAELAAGNWPSCGDCGQPGMLEYLGVLAGCPTFTCRACHALMGVDLPDVPT